MNSLEVFGVHPFEENDLDSNKKIITKDINLFLEDEVIDINKIYIYPKGTVIKNFFSNVIDDVTFIYGNLKIRIEFLNDKNKVCLKDFSLCFSEEIQLNGIIDETMSSNIDIDVTIKVNDLFYKILNNHTIFLSALLSLSLDVV